MDLASWTRVEILLDEALALPPEGRHAFVVEAAGTDDTLRHEMTSILAAFEHLERSDVDFLGTAAEPSPSEAPALAEGDLVGPWRIGPILGRGGMAEVYRAERADGQYEQTVALKLTKGRPAIVRRFVAERRILAGLQHPHIARLVDGGVSAEGRPYLAMEFVDGVPITEFATVQHLDVPARLRVFDQICEAVAYAHRRLIVHRDLKPGNILVATDDDGLPRVKLLDFGIAKLLDVPADATLLTQANARPMTPAYAAPEQLEGREITTAADVFALGVLLYELLARTRPYSATEETPTALLRAMERETLAAPSGVAERDGHPIPARYQRDLDAIVQKALRYAPEDRYPSIEALREDVTRALSGLPVAARKGNAGYRMQRFMRRHRVGVSAAVAGVLALAVGLGAALWQGGVAADERDRAQREARTAEEVSAFLVGLFAASNPEEAQGDTLTAFDLLARGEAQADQLQAEPEAQATLLRTIGTAYLEMGKFADAQRVLERSLERCLVLAAETGRCEFEATSALADLAIRSGRPDEARTYAERQENLARPLDHGTGTETARALGNLSQAYLLLGNFEKAERNALDAYAIQRRLAPSKELATTANNVGGVYLNFRRLDEAEPYLKEALEHARTYFGPDHPSTLRYTTNLAGLYGVRGDFEAAKPLMESVLAARRRVLGPEHPDVALAINNLGMLHWRMGEAAVAERLFRQSVAHTRRSLGDRHPYLAGRLINLAELLTEQGRFDEAEAHDREALAIYRGGFGDEHPDTASGYANLGFVLWRRGDAAAAEPYYRRALAIGQRLLPPAHSQTLGRLGELADIREARGDSREAARLRASRDSLASTEE